MAAPTFDDILRLRTDLVPPPTTEAPKAVPTFDDVLRLRTDIPVPPVVARRDIDAYEYIDPSQRTPADIQASNPNVGERVWSGVKAVGGAMADAWQHTPPLLKPEGQVRLDGNPIFDLRGPMVHVADTLRAGGNALYRGAQEQVVQLANGLVAPALQRIPGIERYMTPSALGRDIASIPDMFMGSPHDIPRYRTSPPVTEPVPKAPVAPVGFEHPREYYAAPEPAPASVKPGGADFTVSPSGVAESTAGAKQTPAADAAMTDAQVKAARYQAESDRILEMRERTKSPTVDTTPYVEGYKPTLAEHSGNPEIAVRQRVDLSTGEGLARKTALDTENDQAHQSHFDRIAGGPVQKETWESDRNAQAKIDTKKAWENKKPVDVNEPSPGQEHAIVPRIKQILDGPDGKNPAVEKALNTVTEKLKIKGTDAFESDPAQIYGVRDMVNKMLSNTYKSEHPTSVDAAPHLMELKHLLDEKIEQGAPGYNQFRKNYAEASKPIDAAEYLQDARANLFRGGLNFGKYETFLGNLAKARNRDGFHISQSITHDQMNGLTDLGFNLARKARENAMGKVAGSDTHQRSVVDGGLPVRQPNALQAAIPTAKVLAQHGLVNAVGEAIYPGAGVTANGLLAQYQGFKAISNKQMAFAKAEAAKAAEAARLVKEKSDRINSYFEPPPAP